MKKLFLKTWRDIKSRKGQFGALIILVALGIASYVSFTSSYYNLSASADLTHKKLKLADFSTKVIAAPKMVVEEIKDIDGVAAVEGRLIVDTGLELGHDNQATARLIGLPSGRHPKVNDVLISKGDYLKKEAKNQCLLTSKFAKETNKEVGDKLTIIADSQKQEIEITGVVASPEYLMPRRGKSDFTAPGEFAILFMNQSQVEKLFNRPPIITDVSVLLEKGADRKQVIDEVEKILKPYKVVETVKREDQPSNFALREEIRQNREIADTMPMLILIISALTLYIALSRLVQSQRGEIGLTKALGYRDWQILLQYLLFSLFIAFAGSAIGFAFGQYLGKLVTQMYIDILNIPILKHKVYPQVVTTSVMLSTFFCVIAGLVPAITSARMLPARAMRFDPSIAVAGGKIPIVERILGWALPASFTFRIPLRDVFRARRRSLYTVIGIAFALVLTVVTWSMFDSIDYLIDTQFNRVEKYDVVALFRENFSSNQLRMAGGVKGVEKAQAALQVPAKLEANGEKHEGAVTAIKPKASFHGFRVAEGDSYKKALAKDGLIIPQTLAKKLKVEVGDKIKVKTPYLNRRRLIEVRAVSDELLGIPIFTSIEQGKQLVGSNKVVYNTLYLNVDEKEAKGVRKKLYEMGAAHVQIKESLIKMIDDLMSFMWVMGGVLFAFGFSMAFIVIYNTFTANIIERTREIATMITIGEDRSHLTMMITLENLLLAVVGIPVGLYLGFLAAQALFQSLSTEVYTLKAVIYSQSYVWITLSILGILLLSEIPPIRRVFKLDLAEATKAIE